MPLLKKLVLRFHRMARYPLGSHFGIDGGEQPGKGKKTASLVDDGRSLYRHLVYCSLQFSE